MFQRELPATVDSASYTLTNISLRLEYLDNKKDALRTDADGDQLAN